MVDITDSIPPVNIEVEEAILGGILLDPEAYGRVKDKISTAMFSLQHHRIIYKVMVELVEKGKPTDLMAVSTRLADRELLDTVGGTSKLGQLLNRTVSAVNIDRYAEMLFEKWESRELIKLGHELIDLGYDQSIERLERIRQAKSKFDSWISSDDEEREEPLIGKMTYVVTAREVKENYEEAFKLESEIDLKRDSKEQIKKMREEVERLLKE